MLYHLIEVDSSSSQIKTRLHDMLKIARLLSASLKKVDCRRAFKLLFFRKYLYCIYIHLKVNLAFP